MALSAAARAALEKFRVQEEARFQEEAHAKTQKPTPRFRVALAFAAEKRDYVEEVARQLAEKFGQDKILYDRFHEAEFARPDLDSHLIDLYLGETELIVAILSTNYEYDKWSGLGWRAILSFQRKLPQGRLLLLRPENVETANIQPILDAAKPYIAYYLILERLANLEGHPTNYYFDDVKQETPNPESSSSPPSSSLPIDSKESAKSSFSSDNSTLPQSSAAPSGSSFKSTFAFFESDLVAFDPNSLKTPLQDALGVQHYASHIGQLIAARETPLPLSIGLFGDWGSGKSYFMRLLHQEIESISGKKSDSKTFCKKIVQIHFNAWHYLDTNLWANLVCEIFDQLFLALTARPDTANDKIAELKKQLGEQSALATEAHAALDDARNLRSKAETAFKEAQEKRLQHERTLSGILENVSGLVVGEEQKPLREQLNKVANALGMSQLSESFEALESRAEEVQTLHGRVRAIALAVFTDPNRWLQIVLLIFVLSSPFIVQAIGPFIPLIAKSQFAQNITQIVTFIGAFATWLSAQIKRGNDVVDQLESAYKQVKAVRETKRQKGVAAEQEQLDESRKKEDDARFALEAAESKVRAIKSELQELAPGRRLFRFLEGRSGAADYRQHLGIVSLVRRDFEQLNRLLRENEAFKVGDQPMLDRIVLYIDDLDRCRTDRVIEVLEAVHLLLAFPLFAVVVAVDPRWLRKSLLSHYPTLLNSSEGATTQAATQTENAERLATPQDYLEKIFQVPFQLQKMESSGFKQLVGKLFPTPVQTQTAQSDNGSFYSLTQGTSKKPDEDVPSPDSEKVPPTVNEAKNSGSTENPNNQPQGNTAFSPDDAEQITVDPQRLQLEKWEIEALEECYPLFKTPRAVKRLANTYCLIRVGVAESKWSDFLGSQNALGTHRIPMLMLAVSSAFPGIAQHWLEMISDANCDTWIPEDFFEAQKTASPFFLREEWQDLQQYLGEMQADHFADVTSPDLRDWITKVRRYSF